MPFLCISAKVLGVRYVCHVVNNRSGYAVVYSTFVILEESAQLAILYEKARFRKILPE